MNEEIEFWILARLNETNNTEYLGCVDLCNLIYDLTKLDAKDLVKKHNVKLGGYND